MSISISISTYYVFLLLPGVEFICHVYRQPRQSYSIRTSMANDANVVNSDTTTSTTLSVRSWYQEQINPATNEGSTMAMLAQNSAFNSLALRSYVFFFIA